MIIFNDPSRFGRLPDPPEPESDEWFEEHCPRCKYNHEYEENGKWYSECTQGGCTGFEELECDDTYQEGLCEDCDRFEQCKSTWRDEDDSKEIRLQDNNS